MDEQYFVGLKTYQELNEWRDDRSLTDRVRACVDVQKRAAGSVLQSAFTPDRQAAVAAVSEEALVRTKMDMLVMGNYCAFP